MGLSIPPNLLENGNFDQSSDATYGSQERVLRDRPTTEGWCVLLVVSVVACAGCTSKGSQPTNRKGEGGVPVTVALATQRDVPLQIEVIGNVEAYSTITVKAQVGGEITQVHFSEGELREGGRLAVHHRYAPAQRHGE